MYTVCQFYRHEAQEPPLVSITLSLSQPSLSSTFKSKKSTKIIQTKQDGNEEVPLSMSYKDSFY